MFFDLIQCEYSFPAETGFLNVGPVLNSVFNGSSHEITCGQVFFPAAGLVNIQCRVAVTGSVHTEAALMFPAVSQQTPRQRPQFWGASQDDPWWLDSSVPIPSCEAGTV